MLRTLTVSLIIIFLMTGCASSKKRRSDEYTGSKTKATQRPYTVMGKRYEPLSTHENFVQTGVASWYGKDFHGKKTSNGEIYNMYAMTAAHKTLPLGVYVNVHNTKNGRDTVVRVNDRGPFVKGRIIDLSYAAAKKLGVDIAGTAFVRVEALGYKQQQTGETKYEAPTSYDLGNYTVQVGAFKDKDNAERLSALMKKQAGYSEVRAADVEGELFYRVYAGKYSSLAAAENAEDDFSASGYPGSFVVSLD